MQTTPLMKTPYFDPQQVGEELAQLVKTHGSVEKARPAVLARLKGLLRTARAAADAGEALTARLAVVDASLDRLEALFGGSVGEGKAAALQMR